ncbi:TRAP transporter substrate-binding protein DctP [Anaerotruncus sp. AF02-27]|jgi:tripartite ATP-independent transporter DctP family solute receptor|uniref:DctP family TRAP transporter solute-binding subunit n=1 Tax=Anaerotruncus TaxID=244127 RepID=UPI000E4E30E5|nr:MULTISPECIES: DctP family TRAP transporter solute-binding subunit [Anaerotruncus]RGX54930.1 TRAP transporter substrate-binding protein DctP [Anaerotruncus sp. AF02-27]
MKKLCSILLATALCMGALAGCASSPGTSNTAPAASGGAAAPTEDDQYEKLNLKISTSSADLDIATLAANRFAELVEEASGGKITAKVYSNCQLSGGDQAKGMELLVSGGSYEMAVFSGSVISNVDVRFLTHWIPFSYNGYEEVNKVLNGTGGEAYAKLLAEKGVVWMAGLHNGLRHITNNKKEIRAPEDLRGMKIRIPNGEVPMETFKAFGSDPVAMNWSEVFTALQQGTIDGQENAYFNFDSNSLSDVQKYITECGWSYDLFAFMANQAAWDEFSEPTQKLLMEKAAEAAQYGREYQESLEVEQKQKFIDAGVTISELTDEQRQAFVDVVTPVRQKFIEKFGSEICSAWGIS